MYLSAPTAATDPAVPSKVLKFFQKTCEASSNLSFTVADADVSNWDVAQSAWVVGRGVYGVSVGSSSADIRLTGKLTI